MLIYNENDKSRWDGRGNNIKVQENINRRLKKYRNLWCGPIIKHEEMPTRVTEGKFLSKR